MIKDIVLSQDKNRFDFDIKGKNLEIIFYDSGKVNNSYISFDERMVTFKDLEYKKEINSNDHYFGSNFNNIYLPLVGMDDNIFAKKFNEEIEKKEKEALTTKLYLPNSYSYILNIKKANSVLIKNGKNIEYSFINDVQNVNLIDTCISAGHISQSDSLNRSKVNIINGVLSTINIFSDFINIENSKIHSVKIEDGEIETRNSTIDNIFGNFIKMNLQKSVIGNISYAGGELIADECTMGCISGVHGQVCFNDCKFIKGGNITYRGLVNIEFKHNNDLLFKKHGYKRTTIYDKNNKKKLAKVKAGIYGTTTIN